jgi:hypothetical protein
MQRRGEKIVESPVEARQDLLGRPVPFVLVVRCTLAIVALAFRSMRRTTDALKAEAVLEPESPGG